MQSRTWWSASTATRGARITAPFGKSPFASACSPTFAVAAWSPPIAALPGRERASAATPDLPTKQKINNNPDQTKLFFIFTINSLTMAKLARAKQKKKSHVQTHRPNPSLELDDDDEGDHDGGGAGATD